MPGKSEQQAAGNRPAERERCGPLEIVRTRKDDGRALLLYSHDERNGDDREAPEADGDERRQR